MYPLGIYMLYTVIIFFLPTGFLHKSMLFVVVVVEILKHYNKTGVGV